MPTVRSLGEVPFVPELVVITAPASAVPGLIDEAGRRGSAGALIIRAGLGHGAGSLADAAERAAQKYGMRLIGPNCLGIMMPSVGLNASFSAHMPAAGNLALISQSGAIAAGMVDWAAQRAVGFSGIVSIGDQLDVDIADLLDYFALRQQDPGDPALYRGDQGRAQVHVGGARRRAGQAGRGGQVRPHGARREGRRDPHRRARRFGCGLRRRVPSRRHFAGRRSSRIVRLRRDARAAQLAARESGSRS